MRWPTRQRAWLRPRDRIAARVRQCRRRLRLERQPPGRERPLGRRGRTGRDLYAPQGLRLRPHRPSRAADGAAQQRAGQRRSRLPEPRLGRARRHHRRSLFRHAGRHQPRGEAVQGRPRPPVYIGDQTRGDGTVRTLARAGGAGDPHPDAQSEMVRGHAQARLRRRAPDRGARHQHDGLVGDDRRGGALGLPAADADLRARRRDARAAGGAQSDGFGQGREPPDRGARAQLLDARSRDARGLAQGRRRSRGSPRRHWRGMAA